MNQTLRFKPQLRGTVALPTSKSLLARALVLSALAQQQGTCEEAMGRVRYDSLSDDTLLLQRALKDQGPMVDIGPAGTAMRFCTARFATLPGHRVLTGTPRMKERPIGILVDALRRLGADIAYTERDGYPPLLIQGHPLRGGTLTMPASVSSQYVSAVLMIAPMLSEGLTLRLEGHIGSRPYIDMTLALMRLFGADARWTDSRTIAVKPGVYYLEADYTAEADWSAASYWYEMVALSPDAEACLRLPHLYEGSLQGDAAVQEWFAQLGVATTYDEGGVTLTKTRCTDAPLLLDLSQQPDLAQTLAVTCAMQRRPFTFTGLESLRIKETDRMTALIAELGKLGCSLSTPAEGTLAFSGHAAPPTEPPAIDTYQDHRMAMAFAPCAYRHDGLTVREAEVVSKSYPTFWHELSAFQL